MLYPPILISPSIHFWSHTINTLFEENNLFREIVSKESFDFSGWQVVVPNSIHIIYWRAALLQKLKKNSPISSTFILPKINTKLNWLTIWVPLQLISNNQYYSIRLIRLYLQLRQYRSLKKICLKYCHANLLSLAQALLSLSIEITDVLLSTMQNAPDTIDAKWKTMLAQLSPLVRNMLSDEIQLIWFFCKKELISNQTFIKCFSNILIRATMPIPSLIWISSIKLNTIENILLRLYSQYATVQPIILDWRSSSIPILYQKVWPEIIDTSMSSSKVMPIVNNAAISQLTITGIKLCSMNNFENSAIHGAQIIFEWLKQGKTNIAIVAQDYISACRLSTLLKRAKILVTDEIGQKLASTQAATTLMSWCDVISEQSDIIKLLDFLKLPFVLSSFTNKIVYIMQIESQLRQRNIFGAWRSNIFSFLKIPSNIHDYLQKLALQAVICNASKTLISWNICIREQLDILGIYDALKQDVAGQKILILLEYFCTENIVDDNVNKIFSFLEWRTFIDYQLNTIAFLPETHDHRVVILSLNNIRLRNFDAVLVLGVDAEHLPTPLQEIPLFFSNAIRHQFGLSTYASRQCQELRDLIELFCTNTEVVLHWQTHKANGESNLFSPILERLQLYLAQAKMKQISKHQYTLPMRHLLMSTLSVMPAPVAPELLPTKLSATAYNSLISCPYQFFVLYMLKVVTTSKLLYTPKKYNYGDWLHKILAKYHSIVRDQAIPFEGRLDVLKQVSDSIFNTVVSEYPTMLSYMARWDKTIPAYLLWANKREQSGWYFKCSEVSMQKKITSTNKESIELYGRFDRIDENHSGEQAILDYKVQNLPTVIARLKKSTEDYQLIFYSLLSEQNFIAAHYVALEIYKTQISDVTVLNFKQQQQKLQEQIRIIIHALAQGASLPANGIKAVCQYCKVRGLCRKGIW